MAILTVVLLTYNHASSIAEALDSILEQKTNFEFDVHVLDDCSTDETSNICKEYSRRWPGKIYHFQNKTNLGVERNFKEGVIRIASRYFAFLEGDDKWTDPQKLQLQVDMLEEHPECSLSGHNVMLVDHVTGEQSFFVKIPRKEIKEIYSLEDGISIHPSARVYRNVVDFSCVPDYMVLDTHIYRLFLQRGSCVYIDRVMSLYNKTGSGYWTGMSKREKKLMTLKLRYASLQYYDFKHEAEFYSRTFLLRVLKRIFGVKAGWKVFYYLEKSRLKVKYIGRG